MVISKIRLKLCRVKKNSNQALGEIGEEEDIEAQWMRKMSGLIALELSSVKRNTQGRLDKMQIHTRRSRNGAQSKSM